MAVSISTKVAEWLFGCRPTEVESEWAAFACSACHCSIHHLKPANDNQLRLPFPITDDG
jgi:hypothetical protein